MSTSHQTRVDERPAGLASELSGCRWSSTVAWSLLLSVLLVAAPARAINIVLNFDAAGSTAPIFDPDFSRLSVIFAGVEQYWEDIIEDPGVVSITYRYRPLDSGVLAGGSADTVSGGKPTTGHVNINSNPQTWYMDLTPLVHDEYLLQQAVYQDLDSSDKAAWYTGAPPPVLEAAYRGLGIATDPVTVQVGFDMFTTALHEVGHVLGLSHEQMAKAETVGEGDYDFDVATSLVGGATMAINAAGNDPNDVQGWAHVAASSLMCYGCGNTGLRFLPSATDVFAIASAAGWTQIDLKRKDFLSGGNWHTAANWIGNRVPDADDDAFLQNALSPITAGLSADAVANNLTLDHGARLSTNNHLLDVGHDITVVGRGSVPFQTRLRVTGGGRVEAETVSLWSGGELTIEQGTLWANELEVVGGFTGQFAMLPGATLSVNRLTGFGDELQFLGNLDIGHAGPDTGLLEIGQGQTLLVLGTTTVGASAGGSGTAVAFLGGTVDTRDLRIGSFSADGYVEVDGYLTTPGLPARWDVDGTLTIGSSGTGTGTMVVERGGVATVSNSVIVLGTAAAPGGITVQTNGTLQIENNLEVNSFGTAELLGGQLITGSLAVASGGAWTHEDGALIVDGGSFSPPASPTVADAYVIDGFEAADLPQVVLRNGAMTFLSPSNLYVGRNRRGMLQIESGAVAYFTGDAYLGWGLGEDVHGTVNVIGDSSLLIVDGDLEVGDGRVGRMTIEQGGGVDSSVSGSLGRDVIGQDAGTADGEVLVAGVRSLWKTDDLIVGDYAPGRLIVTEGGRVETIGNALIGAHPGSGGSFVTLVGPAAHWQVSGTLNVLQFGTLSGDGLVEGNVLNDGGTVSPGASAGVLSIAGAYEQTSAGVLAVEIGGLGPGESHDVLLVNGDAVLNGILDVSLIDPLGGSNIFEPAVHDAFQILTVVGGMRFGTFATQPGDLPPLPAGREWGIFYGPDFVLLEVLSAILAGDYNRNGIVDAADYTVWRDMLGQTGEGLAADGSGPGNVPDGVVDQLDYAFWVAHFGETAAGSGAAADAGSAAVPEPAAAILLFLGIAALRARTRFHAYSVRRRRTATVPSRDSLANRVR